MARRPGGVVEDVLGLYLHIPFCSAICNYCNFNRGLYDEPLKRRYVAALCEEIRRAGVEAEAGADTIYFGGGTPSLLDPADVSSLIGACQAAFAMPADSEITLEANPETVTLEKLVAFRDLGVNRVSFGVQSFRDDELRRLSRLHDAARAKDAYGWARQAGFDNVSLDLMMWLPDQTLDHWLESVDGLITLSPDHASLYLLELYPNAPLRDEMARAGQTQSPDDDAAEMYLAAMERLEDAGYAQYEISNVARPGRRARHNLKYWTDGEWMGFGCGAHSTRRGVRWKNVSRTDEYVQRVGEGASAVLERRVLAPTTQLEEALFMGLRLVEGIDIDAIGTRYGVDVWGRYGASLEPHLEQGMLRRDGSRLRLTREGLLLSHEVMAVFV